MNDSTPPPFPPQPPVVVRTRKGWGCFAIGCLVVVVGLVLVVAGVGGVAWLVMQGGQAFVSDHEVSVRVAPTTDEQYQAVLAKLAPFGQAMNDGQAATLEITPDDLNALVARSPQFDALRGRLFLAVDGDHLVADLSVPLTDDADHQRYVTGRATLDASYASNGFVVFVRHLEPLDHAQADSRFARALNSQFFLDRFSTQMSTSLNDNFRQQADKDAATASFLQSLRTIVVQHGKIVVTLNERPGGTPAASPAATPVATGDNQT